MDLSGKAPPTTVGAPPAASAPNIEQDTRPAADALRTKVDPSPEVPVPLPPSTSQTGLVSAVTLSASDSKPRMEGTSVPNTERILKPYGISMLPEKNDSEDLPKQNQDEIE